MKKATRKLQQRGQNRKGASRLAILQNCKGTRGRRTAPRARQGTPAGPRGCCKKRAQALVANSARARDLSEVLSRSDTWLLSPRGCWPLAAPASRARARRARARASLSLRGLLRTQGPHPMAGVPTPRPAAPRDAPARPMQFCQNCKAPLQFWPQIVAISDTFFITGLLHLLPHRLAGWLLQQRHSRCSGAPELVVAWRRRPRARPCAAARAPRRCPA